MDSSKECDILEDILYAEFESNFLFLYILWVFEIFWVFRSDTYRRFENGNFTR